MGSSLWSFKKLLIFFILYKTVAGPCLISRRLPYNPILHYHFNQDSLLTTLFFHSLRWRYLFVLNSTKAPHKLLSFLVLPSPVGNSFNCRPPKVMSEIGDQGSINSCYSDIMRLCITGDKKLFFLQTLL